nr:hypothetical protein [Cellulomonas sp. P24]
MTVRGSPITDFTPTARCSVGSFARMPEPWARNEFTPSAATTTCARSSSSPARTPTHWPPSMISSSTRTPGITITPASSHREASHASSLARSTVTAFTGSASRASQ